MLQILFDFHLILNRVSVCMHVCMCMCVCMCVLGEGEGTFICEAKMSDTKVDLDMNIEIFGMCGV